MSTPSTKMICGGLRLLLNITKLKIPRLYDVRKLRKGTLLRCINAKHSYGFRKNAIYRLGEKCSWNATARMIYLESTGGSRGSIDSYDLRRFEFVN